MIPNTYPIDIRVIRAKCGDRDVILGSAPAAILASHSFADVFDEDRDIGYQRPFNEAHSRDFRRYIQRAGATTIPLTFNLRRSTLGVRLVELSGAVMLRLERPGQYLSQVDCQHRLGNLQGVEVDLAFMCFLELDEEEEREVFTVINSKAKGLSSSLLDYNSSRLTRDLCAEDPCLYIALSLADDADSVWRGRISKGGATSVGMKRVASLRLMKLAVRDFFKDRSDLLAWDPREASVVLKEFWRAVVATYTEAWMYPRSHLLTKGIGVYCLTRLAGELTRQARARGVSPTERYFAHQLLDYYFDFDWSSDGELAAYGGTKGAEEAFNRLAAHKSRKQPDSEKWQTKTFS